MTILLTGATGFIGRHVLSLLLKQGHEVIALVRPSSLARLPMHPRLRALSVESLAATQEQLRGVDALLHLAAHGVVDGLNDWDGCFRVNLHESLALWRCAANAGVKRMILCGSCFEYGRSGERYEFIPVDTPLEPTNAYGASKAAASMAAMALATEKNLQLLIARPFHVYGEGEAESRFWPSLRRAALAGEDFKMTKGEQVRDFIPVEDVAAKFIEACCSMELNPGVPVILNVGSGQTKSLLEFSEFWWHYWRATGKLIAGAIHYRENEVMRFVPKY